MICCGVIDGESAVTNLTPYCKTRSCNANKHTILGAVEQIRSYLVLPEAEGDLVVAMDSAGNDSVLELELVEVRLEVLADSIGSFEI